MDDMKGLIELYEYNFAVENFVKNLSGYILGPG